MRTALAENIKQKALELGNNQIHLFLADSICGSNRNVVSRNTIGSSSSWIEINVPWLRETSLTYPSRYGILCRERLLRGLVLDELDRPHQPPASNVPNIGMTAQSNAQSRSQTLSHAP